MGSYNVFMGFLVIEWDMNGIYPPVNEQFATDNGPFVEDLPIKMVMSYSLLNYQRVFAQFRESRQFQTLVISSHVHNFLR